MIMNHTLIQRPDFYSLKMKYLTPEQRNQLEEMILHHYFSFNSNTPEAIHKRTGILKSSIANILRLNIVPGADLKELKRKYTS